MNIKHIFFDLDHTLWDFDKNSDLAFEKCFEDYGISMDLQSFSPIYNPINQKYWKMYAEGSVTKEKLKYARFKETFDLLHFHIEDETIHQLSDLYLEMLPHFNNLPEGTIEILDYLLPNYTLHIITNGFNEVSFKKMEYSGISKYFNEIITSENAGAKKPDPLAFHYAMQKANALPQESMMIGDNLEADVKGALAVGMHAIHYNNNGNPIDENVLTVKHLLDLKDYF